MWKVSYLIEGVKLEAGPFGSVEDAALWANRVAETLPDVSDVEVSWEGRYGQP